MNSGHLSRVDQALADLSKHDSSAERAALLRRRCHAVLARTAAPVNTRPGKPRRVAESVVLGAFCFAYLCAVVLTALTSEGVL